MKLLCHACNHVGKAIFKMGGLICRKCRIILKYPNEPEYKTIQSGMAIKIIQGNKLPLSGAARMNMVQELMGGQPIYDDEGNKIGVTEALITPKEARKLLGFED